MDDSRTRQELQALASVYLTGPAPSLQLVGADSDTAHSVEAEVVLLGHLPGFASTWVSQHAAMTAQRGSGNAVLVRFEDGRAHLEHYGETPASPAAAGTRGETGVIP